MILSLIGAKVITVQAQEQRPAQALRRDVRARSRTEATIRARAVASIEHPIFNRSALERCMSICR
jgi:hypothetical protein